MLLPTPLVVGNYYVLKGMKRSSKPSLNTLSMTTFGKEGSFRSITSKVQMVHSEQISCHHQFTDCSIQCYSIHYTEKRPTLVL